MLDKVDVLIVGSGASGAAVAWSLADTKMRIVCLEQGDWVKPTDYPSNGRDWEARLFSDFVPSADEAIFKGPPVRGRAASDPAPRRKFRPKSLSSSGAAGESGSRRRSNWPAPLSATASIRDPPANVTAATRSNEDACR